MGKKLRANSEYRNGPRGLYFKPGDEFAPSDDLFLFLMADAPGVFEIVTPLEGRTESKAVAAPPADKMVKQPKAKK